ncbi:hypothetical protein EMIHUDRAFT_439864 [Emiliania huxleyi CCMP1516]|uniref:Uncharacterized protein n=2 Tax=Emiliania huxleyi TaxID=2903 RepID=A0A0D3KUD2_EMIH1|nr:hypothetical protein EMIHUDRAFT_439864 [Emiliania huxleyi CCMP1516]EOD39367.1 hypothetical protein EMIHUDRAFT_439864 [Emiliania huxleyi CCMP1516]|eukprot:XP_005791796.1 hypothetical protein EMIHUDRAFT_439864 [Emiliania huxleyi CCMP1516]
MRSRSRRRVHEDEHVARGSVMRGVGGAEVAPPHGIATGPEAGGDTDLPRLERGGWRWRRRRWKHRHVLQGCRWDRTD